MDETDIIEVADGIRVEPGFKMEKGYATKELLDNAVTANHYQVGKKDAMNKTIVLGEEMSYLDYHGPKVFYLFKEEWDDVEPQMVEKVASLNGITEVPDIVKALAKWDGLEDHKVKEDGGKYYFKRWVVVADYPTEAAALVAAKKIGG